MQMSSGQMAFYANVSGQMSYGCRGSKTRLAEKNIFIAEKKINNVTSPIQILKYKNWDDYRRLLVYVWRPKFLPLCDTDLIDP
jgi:hypothetical protein